MAPMRNLERRLAAFETPAGSDHHFVFVSDTETEEEAMSRIGSQASIRPYDRVTFHRVVLTDGAAER